MAKTILGYLKDNRGAEGDFLKEYKRLDPDEKASLQEDACRELEVLGIELPDSKAN